MRVYISSAGEQGKQVEDLIAYALQAMFPDIRITNSRNRYFDFNFSGDEIDYAVERGDIGQIAYLATKSSPLPSWACKSHAAEN